jgi:hypothetical protein
VHVSSLKNKNGSTFSLIEESGKYVQDFFAGVYINTKRCFMSGADIHQLYQHLVMLACNWYHWDRICYGDGDGPINIRVSHAAL